MTLDDYDQKVKPHLDFIEAGAAMAERHTRALLQKPDFATLAEDDLSKVRATLMTALARIITAQHVYRETPGGA